MAVGMMRIDECEGAVDLTGCALLLLKIRLVSYSSIHIPLHCCGQPVPRCIFMMADVDELPQPDPPAHVDLSEFRNGQDPRDTDIFIAVMGVTGAGKSTLISHLAPGEAGPEIGKDLSSCSYHSIIYISLDFNCTNGMSITLRYSRLRCIPIRLFRWHKCLPGRYSRI